MWGAQVPTRHPRPLRQVARGFRADAAASRDMYLRPGALGPPFTPRWRSPNCSVAVFFPEGLLCLTRPDGRRGLLVLATSRVAGGKGALVQHRPEQKFQLGCILLLRLLAGAVTPGLTQAPHPCCWAPSGSFLMITCNILPQTVSTRTGGYSVRAPVHPSRGGRLLRGGQAAGVPGAAGPERLSAVTRWRVAP